MAKLMSYTDERGITSPESYWKLTNIYLDTMAKQASLTFSGFATAEARTEKKVPVGQYTCYIANIPEATNIEGEETVVIPANPRYDRFFSNEAMLESNVTKQGYLAVMDIPGNPFVDAADVL